VLNTNTATAVALLVWTLMDKMAYGKPSIIGAVNGMIAGLWRSLPPPVSSMAGAPSSSYRCGDHSVAFDE